MMDIWKAALQEAQDLRGIDRTHSTSNWEQDIEKFKSRFSDLSQQISRYHVESSTNRPRHKEEVKELILTTRAALRYGLCCISFQDEDARSGFQNHAVLNCDLHTALARLLCMEKADSKCRLLSAQLMSNLATCNETTAESIVSSISISPPKDKISSRILASNFSNDSEEKSSEAASDGNASALAPPNWVDCFLFSIKSGNRGAAAAVTAALHNCICALENKIDQRQPFLERLASDPILTSSMLRNFIPAQKSIESDEFGEWDQATEWINLLLTKMIRLGMLSRMYVLGISRCSSLSEIKCVVLPEQNVLLHCMVKQLEDEKDAVGDILDEIGLDSLEFLANLFCKLRDLAGATTIVSATDDMLLVGSAIISILEIFSSFLAIDSDGCKKVRIHLGTSTELLQQSAILLAKIVDELTKRNEGVKARDMKMSQEEQDQITLLVRVLGNLCFRCQHNQDLMRTTLLPITMKSGKDDDNDDKSAAAATTAAELRNALHVLLSCTTFSTACFTLREWSVIAIRNVLEDNPANQEIVAKLETNAPLQTAALSQAGLQVKLDVKGKVSLTPLKEEE